MIPINIIYQSKAQFYKPLPFGAYRDITLCQEDFLREYFPSSHKINDPYIYPDIQKLIKDKKTDKEHIATVPIERVSIPLQQIITSKRTIHVCGNPVQFIDSNIKPTKKSYNLLKVFEQGWDKKNMEVMKTEMVKSLNITGEAAVCVFNSARKGTSWKVFSILHGDKLHPIYNSKNELEYFGRSYWVHDYKDNIDVEYMEVWDNSSITRYKRNNGTDNKNAEDWVIVDAPERHGYPYLPIVYIHNPEGPCWAPVQDLIEKLELALSQLFENNKTLAFRIMVIKGGFEIQGDLGGQARAIFMDDPDGEANYMDKADVSNSFAVQLEQTMKFIEYGSFIVFPPEIKSGDTPGVAIKVVYSPAWERAFLDINFLNPYMDEIVELFKWYYSTEKKMFLDFSEMDIRGEMTPYIHLNEQEIINNINNSVANGTLSVKTASEEHPYRKNDEYSRILQQQRQEMIGIEESKEIEKTPINN